MIELTEQQVADAKNNDLAAVSAVVAATDERVVQLARRFATTGTRVDEDLAEDLAQAGRFAVWQAIGRFEGTTMAQFFTFINQTLKGTMATERRGETRPGVSRAIAANFEYAVSVAAGDPYEAERLAVTLEVMGEVRRMSPEMAYAARLSWQGQDSMDAPIASADGQHVTLGDRLESTMGIPDDLMTARDVQTARQRVIREHVHATLDKLSDRMNGVLRSDYGIGDVRYYGDVVAAADDEMAADMGIAKIQVQQARTKGMKRFRELYLKGAAA